MEIYILKSVACLGVFFLFYKLVLENTSLHSIKRFFLLGSLVLSLGIPFITFTQYIEVSPAVTEMMTQIPVTIFEPSETIATSENYLPYVLGGIYLLGVLIFSFRFGRNMHRIFNKVRQNSKLKKQSIFHVLLKLPVTPHSFFNYIFFSKKEYDAGAIPQEVIVHETAHVAQKHSWDIVFFELLRIVFWFNPLLYFIKHSIKLNHEFLADRTVLNQGAELSKYQTILLDYSSTSSVPVMAHSINYSSVKKRFTVMKTHTSKRIAWFKGLLVLPLLAVLIYGFSTTQVVEKVPSDSKVEFENLLVQEEYDKWYNETTQIYSKEKATPKQLEIYNKLAKKYNAVPVEERKIGWEDLKTLENIYRLMDDTQKQNALPFPECSLENKTSWEKGYAKDYNEGAARNNKKSIVITINVSEIMVNGKATSLKNFAKEVDKATKNWTTADFQSAHPSVLVAATPDRFMEKVDAEFRKTNYFKANNGVSIIPTSPPPPPPAPDAPKIIKGIHDRDGTIPPPPPQAPKVSKGVNDMEPNIPPPPPPPPSPLDHIIEMAKKGASFYFEEEEITSDKAVAYIKADENLNIQTKMGTTYKKPQVKISTKPITFHKNSYLKMTLFDASNIGPQTRGKDAEAVLDLMIKHGAKLFLNGDVISREKALKLIKQYKSIEIVTHETPHDVASIVFSVTKDN